MGYPHRRTALAVKKTTVVNSIGCKIWSTTYFKKYSRKEYACSFDILLGACSSRLVMATRFFAPNNLLTAMLWLRGIHLFGGSSSPPETRKGRGAIKACNSCRSYPSATSVG